MTTTFRGWTRENFEQHAAMIGGEIAAALAMPSQAERYAMLDGIWAASNHNQRMIFAEVLMRMVAAHPPRLEIVKGGA